jgi:hypothetical protein
MMRGDAPDEGASLFVCVSCLRRGYLADKGKDKNGGK